jgi:hypothetical protein
MASICPVALGLLLQVAKEMGCKVVRVGDGKEAMRVDTLADRDLFRVVERETTPKRPRSITRRRECARRLRQSAKAAAKSKT